MPRPARSAALLVPLISAALLLSGCAPEINPANNPELFDTSTPTPTPTPTLNPIVWKREGFQLPALTPMPASLEKYRAMSIDEFSALPKAKQLKYASYFMQNEDLFYKRYSFIMGVGNAMPYVAPSTKNTADEMEANFEYASMVGRATGAEAGGKKFDQDAFRKIQIAHHVMTGAKQSIFQSNLDTLSADTNPVDVDEIAIERAYEIGVKQIWHSKVDRVTLGTGEVVQSKAVTYTYYKLPKYSEDLPPSHWQQQFFFVPYTDYAGKKQLGIAQGDAFEIQY